MGYSVAILGVPSADYHPFAELGFLKVQIEGFGRYPIERDQTAFCLAPERLNAVDMVFIPGKFIVAVINPEMLVEVGIDQTMITSPVVRADGRSGINFAPDHRLQLGSCAPRVLVQLGTISV